MEPVAIEVFPEPLSRLIEMKQEVDFFVIGGQKCATSWLYYCLAEHPDVQMPRKKDESNYLGSAHYLQDPYAWFEAQFGELQGKRLGSVSVDYILDPNAVKVAKTQNPKARFILCVREPCSRAISAAGFLRRRGVLPWVSTNKLIATGINDFSCREPTAYADLLERGLYASQLHRCFSEDEMQRVLLTDFAEMKEQPEAVLRRIFCFLEIDPNFVPDMLSRQPKRSANWLVLDWLEFRLPKLRVLAKSFDLLNRCICKLGLARSQDELSPSLRKTLSDFFKQDWSEVQRMLRSNTSL